MGRKKKRRRSPKMNKRLKWVVRSRDKVCQHCGYTGSEENPLTIHHIKKRRTHPQLVNQIDNCILLCSICHRKVHKR